MSGKQLAGLIPAAGLGTRLGNVPGSKELLPIPVYADDSSQPRVKPVCTFLLDNLKKGGFNDVFVVLRDGKWDIPAYLLDGGKWGLHIGYAMMHAPYGAPFTLDAAYPFVRDRIVALGFPDMLLVPPTAYGSLLQFLEDTSADIALGLFPTRRPSTTDMVRMETDWRVTELEMRPRSTDLMYCWGIAVWRPVFSEFLHSYISDLLVEAEQNEVAKQALEKNERHIGHVIQAGIQSGLKTFGLPVSDEPFLDIGTPETLSLARSRFRENSETIR